MIVAIALDLGSTSIKAGLLDQHGNLSGIVSQPVPVVLGVGGRYESDASAYAEISQQVLARCVKALPPAQAKILPPLGLCSQRSSFVIWDRATGTPVTPLISWQDNRGAQSCEELQAEESTITELTGLRLTPYFFAPKLRTMLNEHPQWRENLCSGVWMVGTLDTFLIWQWSAGDQHITDVSMAARTLLLDIHTQTWSTELCRIFDIPMAILPQIKTSVGININLNNGLILQASLGDQTAALFASVGEQSNIALVNLGTGGFVIRYVAEVPKSSTGYLYTLAYQDAQLQSHFAIEGTLNSIAAALASYPVAECKLSSFAQTETLCIAEPSGIGAPYFRREIGLKFSQEVEALSPEETACLLLEAIIFRVVRIVEEFHSAAPISCVYLSGGLSELSSLQQGLALCLPCDIFRLQQHESSLQGAAMLATGLKSQRVTEIEKIQPAIINQALQQKYLRWKDWLDGLLNA